MTLFARYVVTVEEAERGLKRPLTGDPLRGEHAVLAALDDARLNDARRLLERDASIRPDFREFIEERLRLAETEPGATKSWTLALPGALWAEYARIARLSNAPISECLVAAIQRDSECRRKALDAVAELDKAVRTYHGAATQLLDELQQLTQRLGPIQEIGVRIARIEAALSRS